MKSQVEFADLKLLGNFPPGDDPNCVGTISTPVRDHVNAATATAMTHGNWSWLAPEKYVSRSIIQGNILPLQRNAAIQRMAGDWLMFIDDDMVWTPDAIGRLVASREEVDADIMGALCFRRSAPYQPTLFMRETPTSGAYNYLEDWDTDVVEVDATGMAFVIIHKRVFEMIIGSPMPPYEVRAQLNPTEFFRWTGLFGEDLQFCQDAKAAGARIFVDTRVHIGHVSEVEIRHRHFLQEMLLRPDEMTAERRKINNQMGLPTLTRERIEELLG
jgi:hypothetical protein